MKGNKETREHHETLLKELIAKMTPEEKEYIQSCLFVVDCFIGTQPVLALQMLKFNKATLSEKGREWDRIIDELSKTLWKGDAPKKLTYAKVKIISYKLGEILKNPTP